jgi:hypothetical protein
MNTLGFNYIYWFSDMFYKLGIDRDSSLIIISYVAKHIMMKRYVNVLSKSPDIHKLHIDKISISLFNNTQIHNEQSLLSVGFRMRYSKSHKKKYKKQKYNFRKYSNKLNKQPKWRYKQYNELEHLNDLYSDTDDSYRFDTDNIFDYGDPSPCLMCGWSHIVYI